MTRALSRNNLLIYLPPYMNLLRAVSVKLVEGADLLPTFRAYTQAYNTCCKIGWDAKEFNGVALHHLTYPLIRDTLPAQLAISARMKATESLKSAKVRVKVKKKTSCPESKLCSIRLDANSYKDRKSVV